MEGNFASNAQQFRTSWNQQSRLGPNSSGFVEVLKLNRFAAVLGKTMGRRSGKDEPPPLQRFTLS
jgi:hypothetical protein